MACEKSQCCLIVSTVGTQVQKDKPLFIFGVIRIGNQETLLVRKDRLGLFKRNPVPSLIRSVLLWILLKAQPCHSKVVYCFCISNSSRARLTIPILAGAQQQLFGPGKQH